MRSTGRGAMVSVSSFVHPTEDSSSDSQETPSRSPSGGSFVGSPDCTTQEEPPVLPPSVTLSVDACFSGATVLITGLAPSDMKRSGSLECSITLQYLQVQPEHQEVFSTLHGVAKKRASLVRFYTTGICVQVSPDSWAARCWSNFFACAPQ